MVLRPRKETLTVRLRRHRKKIVGCGLYNAQKKPAPILEAACWSHGRRKFVDLVKQGEAPIASEAVRRIDMLFEIERSINGKTPEQRLVVRRTIAAAHCRA